MAEDKERTPVNDDPVPQPEKAVTSSAVDTYFRTDAGVKAEQLANALSGLAPELGQFAQVQHEKAAERGETAASIANEKDATALDYRTAVKKGQISSSMNPFFRTAARAQFGRLAATQYGDAFKNDPNVIQLLQNSTNVQDFNKIESQYREQWMKDNLDESHTGDLPFTAEFAKMSTAIIKDERNAFVAQANQRLLTQTTEAHSQEVAGIIRNGREKGETDWQITADINFSNDRAIKAGMSPRLANVAASTAITQAAHDKLDMSIFDLAKGVKAGSGSLYDTSYMGEDRAKNQQEIVQMKARQDTQAREDAAFQRSERVRNLEGQVIDQVLSNPDGKPQDLAGSIRAMAQDDPNRAANLGQLVETLQKGRFDKGDPRTLAHLTVGVWDPNADHQVDMPDIIAARNSGAISTEDFKGLLSQIRERDKDEKENGKNGILADAQYRWGLGQVRDVIAPAGEYDPVRSPRAEQAQSEYIANYIRFAQQQPPPDHEAKQKFIQGQIDTLRSRFAAEGDVQKAGKLPGAHLEGGNVDWRTQRALGLPNVKAIQHQLDVDGKLKPATIQQLKQLGIPPEDARVFVGAQLRLYRISQ